MTICEPQRAVHRDIIVGWDCSSGLPFCLPVTETSASFAIISVLLLALTVAGVVYFHLAFRRIERREAQERLEAELSTSIPPQE